MRYSNKQLLLGKLESVYNTDPTLAGANAKLVSNIAFVPDAGNPIPRNRAYPNFGKSAQGKEVSYSTLAFDVDIVGSGAAGTAPLWGADLRACGFAEAIVAATSVTYTPLSSSFESTWNRFNWDGVAQVLAGCRGTMVAKLEANKEPMFNIAYFGLYHAPTDTAFTSGVKATLDSYIDPEVVCEAQTQFSLFDLDAVMQSFTLTSAGKVVFNDKPNRSGIDIVDRVPTIDVVVEADTVANMDWDGLVTAKTIGELHLTHGTVAGNIVAIDADAVQVTKAGYSDVNGILHRTLTLVTAQGGADAAFTIAVT